MKRLFIFVLYCFYSSHLLAGSAQPTEAKFSPEVIGRFAKNVERFAAKNQARAFIIGRVGRDKKDLPEGINFTHTAIAVYSSISLADGSNVPGYAIYNLYQKSNQADQSELVVDYPVDFFWGVNNLEAGIIIPTQELQQRIIEVLANNQNKLLHNSNYSVIANPFNQQYQNCTEHTLDIINAAIYQTTDKQRLKTNAKAHFKAQKVNINPIKLMFGRLLMDDITTKDHSGKIYTATFTSIAKYLNNNQLLEKAIILNSNDETNNLLKNEL